MASAALGFDQEHYRRIQAGAIAAAAPIASAIDSLGERLRNVFFLGAGGAGYLMGPAADVLDSRSTIGCYHPLGAELVTRGSRQLGPGSLVVLPSLSGTTPDALDHLRYVRGRGAFVLALVGHADTQIADGADAVVVNEAADDTSSESFYLQSLLVSLTVMNRRGEYDPLTATIDELAGLPDLLVSAKVDFEEAADRLAEQLTAGGLHIFTGAGASWAEARYFAMCILEEMQWIPTRPVHASDFFHGTLELVEEGVSVVALKGSDPGRSIVERVEAFCADHTDRLSVVDAAAVPLPGISADVRALLTPVVLAALLERVAAQVERRTGHPLTTRRYYRRMAY
ncbi:MAG: SIS domain-containing protein [Micropruina sp.]|nr:MAG: SIS domain-containing protein [Micropruina sp.]